MKKIGIWLIFGILVTSGLASDFEWKTYTSFFTINDLCSKNSVIWCATEGGMFAYDPSTQSVRTWSRQNGLAYNQVNCVESDTNEILWIGFDNGLLQRLNTETLELQTIFDYEGNSIITLYSLGDSLFVGLNLGLSLYIKSKQEVKETYKQLGSELQVELPVIDIVIEDNTIWAATEQGLAYAQLYNTNLLDPTNWRNVFAEDASSFLITGLLNYNNTLYAGTNKSLLREAENTWEYVQTDQHFKSSGVRDLFSIDSELYVLAGNGVYTLSDNKLNRLGSSFSNGISLTCTNTAIWAGTDRGLKYILQGDQNWNSFIPNSPQGNKIYDLTMDKSGNLWCALRFPVQSNEGSGFCRFDGTNWQVYDKTNLPGLQSKDMRTVVVDDFNNKWIGTWGGGVVLLKSDSTFHFFNAQNDYLGGVSENHNYAVVPDMLVDHNGAVWMLNYRSDKLTYLVSVVSDSASGEFIWTYCNVLSDSLPNCITEDAYGRKWIGTDNNGVVVIDDNNTPSINSDDSFAGTLTIDDGLESNEITSLTADDNGGVWIGTKIGLYYYFNGLTPNYQVYSLYIQSIFLDGFENLWIGMDQGLSFFSTDSYFGEFYNEENSLLTSNNVLSFTLDNTTGNLYVGTDRGITCLQTPYAEPESDLSKVVMYPNPFIVGKHSSVIIDNLALETAVSIYTPSGYLVKSFLREEINGKMIKWDGKNDAGNYVASGVYVIVAGIEEGETNVGKLAVIH